jgi:2,3-diketo-5-methylthio-1-phosphopentane phosphatase
VGLAVGYAICALVNLLPMPPFFAGLLPTWQPGTLAFLLLGTVAVLSALYPARRAAALDPIETLRTEVGELMLREVLVLAWSRGYGRSARRKRARASLPALPDGTRRETLDSAVAWLMDRDRKSTGLKSLQGRIWDEEYQAGYLRGQVYPDVPPAFTRGRAQGRDFAMFSSASVLAQKRLFSRSEAGDLIPSIRAYFDATTGAKGDARSCNKIARALARAPEAVLFLSDVAAELEPALAAGDGHPPLRPRGRCAFRRRSSAGAQLRRVLALRLSVLGPRSLGPSSAEAPSPVSASAYCFFCSVCEPGIWEVSMCQTRSFRRRVVALIITTAGLLAWPRVGVALTLAGNATAARVTALGLLGGTTTVFADTGTLGGTNDARDAWQVMANVPSVLSGEVLHAVTVGWADQVASEASLANLSLTVGGVGISADFVMARALSALGSAGSNASIVSNLSIGGAPIAVTGNPNQTVSIPGGQVVINEQTVSPSGTTVNALHASVFGVTDVVIASATAGIQ